MKNYKIIFILLSLTSIVFDSFSQAFEKEQGMGRLFLGAQLNNQYDLLQGAKEFKETGVPALDFKGLNGSKTAFDLGVGANLIYFLSPVLSAELSYNYGQFSGATVDKVLYYNSVSNAVGLGFNLSLKSARTADYKWVPYLRANTGIGTYNATMRFASDDLPLSRNNPTLKGSTYLYGYGLGIRYHFSNRLHAYAQSDFNQVGTDAWDGNDNGKDGDRFLRTSIGLRFGLNKKKNRDQEAAWQGAVSKQELTSLQNNVDSVSKAQDSNIKKTAKIAEDLRKGLEKMESDRKSENAELLNRLKSLEGQLENIKRQEYNPTLKLDSAITSQKGFKSNESVVSIYFATGSDKLVEESQSILNNVSRVLNNTPELKIILTPYTDSRGLSMLNSRLRARRSKSVLKVLKGLNLDPSRIIFGEWPGTYIGQHELDRRVDIKFIK